MQAKDIMTVNVISVSEDSPVHEVVGRHCQVEVF